MVVNAESRGVARAIARSEARLAALKERRSREHAALLRAARRVFVARGYSQTRVEDILREAGLSTRAFYRFHASKDQLFLELFAQANDAALRRLHQTVARKRSAAAQLDAYLESTLELAYDPRYRAETRLFASVPGELAERHASEVLQCRAQLVTLLERILAAGRASGEFPNVEPHDDAWSVHGALSSALERILREDPPPERRALLRQLRRFCAGALGSKPHRTAKRG